MNEYIIRETGYPGAVKQEIVGELVRCKDCKHRERDEIFNQSWCKGRRVREDFFCADGERKDDSDWIVTNMEFDESYAEMYGYKRLVRCKDCKYWELSQYNTAGIHICGKFCGVRGEHDFCSRGERKDDD